MGLKTLNDYDSVPSFDSQEEELQDAETEHCPQSRLQWFHNNRPSVLWMFHLLFLGLNILLLLQTLRTTLMIKADSQDTSWWSPAFDAYDGKDDYELVRFAGLHDFNAPWRGEPTPEMEEAWNSVTDEIGEIPVSFEVAKRAGMTLDPKTLVQFPPKHGGQVYVSLEWNHHLHCLDMIRKFIRIDYYESRASAMNHSKEDMGNHLDHCVDMLRQHVMCQPDHGLIFSYWIEGHDHKHVDFNTPHKCRPFEKTLEWAKKQAKHPFMNELIRQEGNLDLPDFPENLTWHTGALKQSRFYQP